MQFLCTHADLKRGLNIVKRAVGERKSHLIESYILLEASVESGLKLTAFNGTIGIEVFVAAEILRPGRATIKADTFHDWVIKLKSDWSLLLEKGDSVKSMKVDEALISLQHLRCSAGAPEEIQKFLAGKKKTIKVTSEFNGMLPETFPELPQAKGSPTLIPAASLLGGIQYCRKSVGANENQMILTGVHLRLLDLWLQFIGTNGHRVAIYQVNAPALQTMDITIPGKALDELKPLLNELKAKDIQLVLGSRGETSNTLLVEYTAYEENEAGERVYDATKGWWRASIRLLSNNPPYPVHILDDTGFIPPVFENKVELDRKELLGALERIAVIVDQLKETHDLSAGKVFFEFTKQGRLLLSGDARDAGRTEEEIEIDFKGNAMIIYMEIQYLLDGLNLIDTDTVSFEFSHPLKPILLKPCGGDSEFKYIVMTIRSHKTRGDGSLPG